MISVGLPNRNTYASGLGFGSVGIILKPLFVYFALAVWISSWFPSTNDTWAILASGLAVAGLATALLAKRVVKGRKWPSQVFFILGAATPVAGVFTAIVVWHGATHADGAIMLFHAAGWAAYLLMIGWVLTAPSAANRRLAAGCAGLLALAAWSWGSAASMYFHRGSAEDADRACILVSGDLRYDTALTSIWKMRLPEVVYNKRARPRSRMVLNYHAVLVAQNGGQTTIYNWSKIRMRFELLDPERNPYIPSRCP